MRKFNHQYLFTILKVLFSLLAIGFVAWRLYKDRDAFAEIVAEVDGAMLKWLLFSLLLLPLNITLEAAKWRIAIRPYYPNLGLGKAVHAILAGMATGIFTPNRIGEYAGRILYLEEGRRLEAIALTFVNRASQMLITLVTGMAALVLLLGNYKEGIIDNILGAETWFWVLFWVLTVNIFAILIFFLWPKPIVDWVLKRWSGRPWIKRLQSSMEVIDGKMMRPVVLLAFLRYLVFSLQFCILLYAFGFEESLGLAYALVSLIFLGKSLFPYLGLAELGVREWVSIEVMGLVGFGALRAFNASLILYLINIILPTLIGVWFLRGIKMKDGERVAAIEMEEKE